MAGTEMKYGGYQFVPVPLMTWNTETIYNGKYDRTYLHHSINFTGTLLHAVGEDSSFDLLLEKRNSLQQALASGHQEWRLDFDGQTYISGVYPQVTNVSFDAGIWTDKIDYSFSLEYDENFYNTGIQSYSESWTFEEHEDLFSSTVTHELSAVGINTTPSGVSNAFSNAKTWVLARTGWDSGLGCPAFIQTSGTYSAYEEVRSEQADIANGSYSVNERFVLSSGTYIHTLTSQIQRDDTGISTITIDGNIRGLGRGFGAYQRALTGWRTIRPTLPAIASGLYSEFDGGATLYTNNYQSYSVTRNEFAGTLGYSVSYTDSEGENLPSGILEFALNISDQKPTRLYASFAIMERALGNVVQDIGTSTEGQFSITGNATCAQDYSFDNLVDFVEQKVNERRPDSADYVTLRLTGSNITKDFERKTLSWNLTWMYTAELSQAAVNGEVSF